MKLIPTQTLISVVLISACSSTPATPDAALADIAVLDAAVMDTAVVDVPTVIDVTPDTSCGVNPIARSLTWANTGAFPLRVDHHGTFVHTAASGTTFLYVGGGIRQGPGERMDAVYDNVHRARINADGSLGMWEPLGPLPTPVGYHGTAQTASHVYFVGGITVSTTGAPAASRAVFVGDYDTNGALTWRRGTSVAGVFVHPSLSVVGNTLVLIGGTDGSAARNRVFISPIMEDGSNGPWTEGPRMPTARSHHTAVVFRGRLYLAGGFSGMPVGNAIEPLPDVLRSVHDDTQAITGWETVATLSDPPATHSALVHDDYMYILGGVVGSTFVATVRRAPFRCDGTLGDFEEIVDLPIARSHTHQTPDFAGHVYSVAGRILPSATSFERTLIGTWQ
jgi:hypothetical protein